MVGLLAALALPASARADARDTLERRLGPQAVVDIDPVTDTPRVVARLDGALTRPASGPAATIGMKWVRENRAALGLTAADLDALERPTVRIVGEDVRQVSWRQSVDGVLVADRELRVNVDAAGRVLNVLGAPSSDLPADTTPALPKPAPDARLTIYDDRLAYRYEDEVAPNAIYDTITDADTGRVLKRTNLVKSLDVHVWDNHPSLDVPARVFDLSSWLTDGTRLRNASIHTYTDINGNNVADASEEVVPRALGFVNHGCEPAKLCAWDGANATRLVNREQNAIQAFYLANRFREHLASPPIGFAGFGDRMLVEASDTANLSGASFETNNANMYTPPAGKSPRMQLYLWRGPSFRNVNGGDDASILYHEYTHALTGRLVVDPDGVSAVNSWQAGAMGEGWSDFYAKDFLVSSGAEVDSAAPGEIHMGTYTDAIRNSIRSGAIDCPVGVTGVLTCPTGGGYTYGRFAKVRGGGPSVHYDGEIWGQTLWDLRRTLPGSNALRLITAALPLAPPEPSFLDMRNAILLADHNSGGTFNAAIWDVFANRGMGFYASAIDGADTEPVEDMSSPPDASTPRGTITGTVRSADGLPLAGATVSVGGLTAGPDALVATTGPDGTYTIAAAPVREYANVVVTAPGHDRVLVPRVTVPASGVDAALPRNWASVRAGATVTSTAGAENADMGCGPRQAVDGLRSSTWSTGFAGRPLAKSLVVRLPEVVDVTSLAIDPGAGCGDGPASGTAQWEVSTGPSPTGPWTSLAEGTFVAADQHRMNAVAASREAVEYVRITPLTTQGGASWIDLSEFAVYGHPHLQTAIISGPTEPGTTATFTFAGTNQTGFQCRLDAGGWEPCTSPKTYSDLEDGPHTFAVRAVNTAGQADASPAQRTFTIDNGRPVTRLLSAPPALSASRDATFTFDGGTSYACTLDGVTEDPCVSPRVYTGLADGEHRFSVTASNENVADRTPETHTFTVDATPPDTLITWAPPPVLTARDFALAFTASEPATFTCSVDGAAAVACASPLALTGLSDGAHSVVVTATDAAGNVDPTPARSDFTVIISEPPPTPTPTPTVGPTPFPTVNPTPTPTVTPKRNALTSATVPKTASRRAGKVKVTLRGTKGAKVAVQAKLGSRVVGKTTRTLRGSRLVFQLTLDRKRLRTGKTVTVRVRATGSGLKSVTRTVKFRLRA